MASLGCGTDGSREPAPIDRDAAPPDAVDVGGDVAAASDSDHDSEDADAQDDGSTRDTSEDEAASPPAPPSPTSWTYIYRELLDNMSYVSNCTGEGCHDPGAQQNLDLSSPVNGYRTIQAKLMPGDPTGSLIVRKLEAGEMPRGRPRMPAADIALLRAWIAAGAPND